MSFLKGSSVGAKPLSFKNLFQKRAYNKWPVACSLPPMYKSTFSQYSKASAEANSVSLCASIYRIQYHDEPAQPGIVLSSRGNTVLFSTALELTTVFVLVSQAQTSARPKGGSPVSVGKYFSTSGKRIGKCALSIICGIPLT